MSSVSIAVNALPIALATAFLLTTYVSAALILPNSVPIAVETAFMLTTAPRAIKAAMSAYSIRS